MELLKRVNEAMATARAWHEYYKRYAPEPVLLPMMGPQLPSSPEQPQTVNNNEHQPLAA